MSGALDLAKAEGIAAIVDLWERFDGDGRAGFLCILRSSPDRDLHELAMWLEDPLLRAVARAPVGPPLPAEVRAPVEAGERSIAAGEPTKSQEEIEEMLEEIHRTQIEIDDLSALARP